MKTFIKASICVIGILLVFAVADMVHAATAVDLGTADDFAILANTSITNTGNSIVNGDLGISPGTSVTGFGPGVVNGTQHINDATAAEAQTHLAAAYNAADLQTPVVTVAVQLGGTTKTPGIYNSAAGTFDITGNLILDAQGDPDAVFIFKTASTVITAASSSVTLLNDAQACNVFWIVGSSATLGADSIFKGNLLIQTSATLGARANIEGRVLAQDAAITMDANIITLATCIEPPPPLINVTKIPDPLALPLGPGSVTYDYAVTNIGVVAMSDVLVTDDMCSPVDFISGDVDSDLLLDLTETWNYSCDTTLNITTTNIVTASGEANGFTAVDTATATVVVGIPIVPPLIHLVVEPDDFVVLPGETVTYTYTVTNIGTETMSDVSITDDTCSPLSDPAGDTNSNDLLEVSETWIYTCAMSLTESTITTATAEGSANGLTSTDVSIVTVVVTAAVDDGDGDGDDGEDEDGLANTGSNIYAYIFVGSVFLAIPLVLLQLTRRSHTRSEVGPSK
jgi:hypothetical protein